MQINVENISKKYNKSWIFKGITTQINDKDTIAILGNNGSGKSTLLQLLSGHTMPTKGTITITKNNKTIAENLLYQYMSYCAPNMELIEEFSIDEFLHFHFQFKEATDSVENILQYIGLQNEANKKIENCSSGMKQRVKLAQAFFSNTPILLLDEPCGNLDESGILLYHKMITDFTRNRIVIVSSNDKIEYNFCTKFIYINDFK